MTSETVGDIRRTDPIRFQVLYNAFSSIVDEMGALLQKVAFSLVVSEGRDYSGTICTRAGDLVASGSTDLPAHLGTIPFTVKGTLDWIRRPPEEFFQPGDVVLVNDPYIGGTHHNDVRAIMPVYFGSRLAAFVQCSAHWTDIGGHVPGTFDPNARSSHGEGLAITPIHIVRRGVFDKEVADLVLRNVRMGEVAFGDLLAQIGAVRLGERRLSELADRYGADTVVAAMDQVIEYSEDVLRGEFLKLPDGEWDVEALIDRDPGAEDDAPLAVRMTLRIEGDRVAMDFSRSSGLAKGAMNASRAVSISSAVVTLKMIFPGAPMNQGVFRAVDFVVPDGLLVSAPFPYPTSGMAAGVYPAVADCVLKAFIQIVPERCMAGPTGLLNIVIGGYDPRPGCERDFVTYLWLEGGWGGRAARKDNHTAMTTFATTATNQPIELQERLFPVRYECYRLEQDSAGAGRSRGGLGVRRRWVLTDGPGVLSDLGDGERFGPWGFAGGHDAAPNRFVYAPGTDRELNIGMFRTGLHVAPGEVLDCFQPGGGGYGDPFTRDAADVVEDVVDGYVSVAGAARDYGVVIGEGDGGAPGRYVLDEDATRRAPRGASPLSTGDVPAAVLVTGAAGRIGRSIAAALCRRGAAVVLADRDRAELERLLDDLGSPAGSRAVCLEADVASDAGATELVEKAIKLSADLAGCVNNAGVEGPVCRIEDAAMADVMATYEVNVFGTMRVMKALVPHLRRRGGGRIVNMASGAGLAGTAFMAAYSSSKHAVVGLTRSAAGELAAAGISVNAVCPGCVESPMMSRIEQQIAALGGGDGSFVSAVPAGRYATADEVAELVAYLVHDAPSYMTGAALVIDGGLRA